MQEALNEILQCYLMFLDFVFEDMLLFNGVSFGWIIICLIVFGILVRSVLALPRGIASNISQSKGDGSNE